MLFKPYFSGHGIYLEKVFKYLAQDNIHSMVLTANYDGLSEEDYIDGVRVYRISMKKEWKKWNLMFTLQALVLLFKKRREFDIIHLHGLWDIYGLFTFFSKIFSKKIILHMVLLGSDDPLAIQKNYKFMRWRFKIVSLIDSFISISSPISTSFKKTCLPYKKLVQIPQGVDTELFSPLTQNQKTHLRRELSLPESQKIVTFVGAIIQRKGVDTLLEAWVQINNRLPDVLLLLIGPDTFDGFDATDVGQLNAFVSKMKSQVHDHNLPAQFLGKSDKINLFLQCSDVFVLPSRLEGFGNVVVEAMSSGIPVVITEMNSVAFDLIENGTQGFIVKDTNELAEKLSYLLTTDTARLAMGEEARKRAVDAFDLVKVCKRYGSLYRELLKC
jgi:glycosyltransferase involved in cell wall biosynthesis